MPPTFPSRLIGLPATSVTGATPRRALVSVVALLWSACLCAAAPEDRQRVDLWHTYAANGLEEEIFLRAADAFRAAHPTIELKVTRIPYLQNLQQLINASQGGEAPDLVRLADTELGKIGHISVSGLPLLEDLRPHLTPMQRARFQPQALAAMRYGEPLLALPASQGCMSLLYNKALFDAAGIAHPQDDWTTDDLLAAAKALTQGDVKGLAIPLKWSYWYIPFQTGFGGTPFDREARPSLDSPGSTQALEWLLDLQRKHQVTGAGADIEAASTRFGNSRAAMTFDGAWNWSRYQDKGLALGQALMPTVRSTGKRLSPLISYFGWAVSKQSQHKPAAVQLALWLTSNKVQREYALLTYTIPVARALFQDAGLLANPMLAGFLKQTAHGLTVPTTRITALVFEQLDTAIEMTYSGKMNAAAALAAANAELERRAGR